MKKIRSFDIGSAYTLDELKAEKKRLFVCNFIWFLAIVLIYYAIIYFLSNVLLFPFLGLFIFLSTTLFLIMMRINNLFKKSSYKNVHDLFQHHSDEYHHIESYIKQLTLQNRKLTKFEENCILEIYGGNG